MIHATPIDFNTKRSEMSKKRMSDIFPIGQRVFFRSGNFTGHHGTVEGVENESKSPEAIFGFLIQVKLDNGRTVFVEKSEHMEKIKSLQ